MIQKVKFMLIAMVAALAFATPAMVTGTAFAADPIQEGLCSGVELSIGAECTDPDGAAATEQVNDLLTDVINIFSIIVGVIAVIFIIIGGLKYITSGGDSGNISSAKNTIIYALVGLVIVALAQFIVRFVLGTATTIGA